MWALLWQVKSSDVHVHVVIDYRLLTIDDGTHMRGDSVSLSVDMVVVVDSSGSGGTRW